jgi:hypothetical protein
MGMALAPPRLTGTASAPSRLTETEAAPASAPALARYLSVHNSSIILSFVSRTTACRWY